MKKADKKKKTKPKKKNAEPEMTWKEAVLAYQINIKEKALEDVRYEMKILDDSKTQLTDRIKVLKNEQTFLMDDILKAEKIPDTDGNEITKEKVILQMKDNWATRSKNAQALEELKETLKAKDEEISSRLNLLEYWKDYRDRGQYEDLKQIHLLEESNAEMETTFEVMTGHMAQFLMKTKEEIEKKTVEVLDKQKYSAAEKAIAKMDKYSKQETIDHDWLSREIEIHRKETEELLQLVEKLENENLQTLSELFHCQMEDLRVSRGFLMTEVPDADDFLEDKLFLEIDLARLKATTQDLDFLNGGRDDNDTVSVESETVEDALVEYFRSHDLNSNNVHQTVLHDLEQKGMNLAGKKLRIHKPKTPSIDEINSKLFQPDDWPVTKSMLLDAIDAESLCNQNNQST